MVTAYLEAVQSALSAAARAESETLERGATLLAQSVAAGGVVHTFGSGHSELVARELVGRSGSLVPINQLIDKTEDLAERLPGYGQTLVAFYDQQYQLRSGEVIIVISNSGINPLPIDIALASQERGLKVIGITNQEQSRTLTSRHPSGRRLFEIADVTLHNHAPPGEAALSLGDAKVGTLATITGAFLINCLLIRTLQRLTDMGHTPPVLLSENHTHDDALSHNATLRRRYQGRLRRAGV